MTGTTKTRQTMARYAFFEQARQSTTYSGVTDALLPLVLPGISGKANTIFSADALSKELAPLFGPDLVINIAESMVEPLARAGYLKNVYSEADGSIYKYTDKCNSIPVSSSFSDAERDLASITAALMDYVSVSRPLKPIEESPVVLREKFVDWITTIDTVALSDSSVKSPAKGNATKATDGTNNISDQLAILFPSFVSWLSRERENIFQKVLTLNELGLVIDLVSEIRVPTTRSKKKINLIAILDSRIILELLGLYGTASRDSIKRLLEMCKSYGVTVITLVHLVDEIKEITYNVIQSPGSTYPGSVNEAIQRHPEIREIARRVQASPDYHIREAGVMIVPYTQIHEKRAEQFFSEKNIREFTDLLPYDKTKINMAKRDAWSLAYAVRRQNGSHSSQVYDSRCVILTRSPLFISASRKYLRSDAVGYPAYAVIPIMELRHFSTMFMMSFGSEVTRTVIRSELVASCDRVVHASPDLTRRIRSVLGKMQSLPEGQLDAALADPTTLAEFALVTGNDPSVVTADNSAALLEVMRTAARKDEELRHLDTERRLQEEYEAKLLSEKKRSDDKDQVIEQLTIDNKKRDEEGLVASTRLSSQMDLSADLVAKRVRDEVKLYWFGVILIAGILAVGLATDSIWHFTKSNSRIQIGVSLILGGTVFYLAIMPFIPRLGPDRLRKFFTRRVAARELARLAHAELKEKVLSRLELD